MFEQVLAEQNPHWKGQLYPQWVNRECFKKVLTYLQLPHIISIAGVRRAGKSTLLKHLINFLIQEEKVPPTQILFTNLEHPYFSQYSSDVKYLEQLFEDYLKIANPQGMIYCFLDEVQFFNKWPVFVKSHYEQKKIKFIITGSNSFLLSSDLMTLLSGRTLPIEVYPFSFMEMLQAKLQLPDYTPLALIEKRHEIRRTLDQFLEFGGFPEVALLENKTLSEDVLASYAKTILYQDVSSRLSLKKPLDLEKLFYYLISNVGTPFSYASLAQLFALSDKTIKEYIKALVDAYLLFEIDHFSYSLKQQVRQQKKTYAIDTGMINATCFKFSENRGKLFENVVFLELKRRNKEIYYYKTTSGYEIDFVTRDKKQIALIQVCVDLHEKSQEREIRASVEAAKELDLSTAIIITADVEKEWVSNGVTIQALPLHKFCTTREPS